LFTTGTEYIALTETVKEAIWLKDLVSDLGLVQGVTLVFYDSQSAIDFSKNQVYYERTKHIDVKYNFIREIKVIQVKKISTADNPIDMLTKLVPSRKFEHSFELLGVWMAKVEPIRALAEGSEDI